MHSQKKLSKGAAIMARFNGGRKIQKEGGCKDASSIRMSEKNVATYDIRHCLSGNFSCSTWCVKKTAGESSH